MKRFFTTLLIAIAIILPGTISAQNSQDIKLLNPNLERGSNFMKTLSDRVSTREFSDKDITLEDLSDLMWAANGINRPDVKRTAPSAMNKQEIDLYAFTTKGVYKYDHINNVLICVKEGDYRSLLAGRQKFAEAAPLGILAVADISKFPIPEKDAYLMGAIDAGIVSENISLFCAAVGIANVPRASMEKEKIKELLNLSEKELPLMNNIIGYFK